MCVCVPPQGHPSEQGERGLSRTTKVHLCHSSLAVFWKHPLSSGTRPPFAYHRHPSTQAQPCLEPHACLPLGATPLYPLGAAPAGTAALPGAPSLTTILRLCTPYLRATVVVSPGRQLTATQPLARCLPPSGGWGRELGKNKVKPVG